MRRLLCERGLLRVLGLWGMLGFLYMLGIRGALLLRNSATGGRKGITLTKTTRRSNRNLLSCRNLRSCRNLLSCRGFRRKRTSRSLRRSRYSRGILLRCLLGGALRNRGNLPRAQGGIHARRLGGVCAGQRLTVATPRILTAARTISQRRRLSGLRGSLLNGPLRRLRGNSRRNCRLRCGSTGRCGLSSRLSYGLDLLTGLRHLSVNGHLTAQELTHAGGQLGHKTLDRAQSRNVGAHVQGCAVHAGGANLHQLLRRTRNAHSVKNGAPITLNRSQRIVRVKLQRRGGGTRRSCCRRSRGIRRRRSMRCRRGVTR